MRLELVRDGLRLFAIEAALTKVPAAFYAAKPIEAQVALASVREPSGLLRRLLDGGNSIVAGRLIGAFRRVGRIDIAYEIRAAMVGAGYAIREADPFVPGCRGDSKGREPGRVGSHCASRLVP